MLWSVILLDIDVNGRLRVIGLLTRLVKLRYRKSFTARKGDR